jgi:protein-disulfide isomerase
MTDDLRPADPASASGTDREPAPAEPAPPTPPTPGTVSPDPSPGAAPASSGGPSAWSGGPSVPAPTPVVPVPPAPRRSPAPVFGYLVAAILGIAIGAVGLTLASGDTAGSATPSPSPVASASPAPSGAPVVDGNTIGQADAPVTVEVWADYQCPFCRLEDLLFGGAVEREYVIPGVARIVYRDFAFLGQESLDAAVAARCAGRQDPAAQLRFHDTLYTFQQGENQGRFVRENLQQMSQIAGVPDAAAFEACLDDPAVLAEVQADTAEGRSLGIDSTPTIRLTGPGGEQVLRGFSQTWPTLRDAIEAVRVPGGVPSASPSPSATPASSAAPSATPASSAAPSATPASSAEPSPSATPTASPAP